MSVMMELTLPCEDGTKEVFERRGMKAWTADKPVRAAKVGCRGLQGSFTADYLKSSQFQTHQ